MTSAVACTLLEACIAPFFRATSQASFLLSSANAHHSILTVLMSAKVAIIGAGPAGCTLARLLIRASILVTIFEGESSISVRAQGGTLDLHTNTGLKALREADLLEEYAQYARYDGEAMNLADKNLVSLIKVGGTTEASSRGRPEIDRARLRQILVDSLPEGTIRWNCRLRNVDANDLSLHFDHGIEAGFDLLVGADGAWSKVRPVLTDVEPYFAGLGGYDLLIHDAEKSHPDLFKLVNRGSLFVYSDGKGLNAQQRGDGTIIVYASGHRDEDWKERCGYDLHNASEVKRALKEEFKSWAEPLVKLIQVADEKDITARSLYILPPGHRWKHRANVTLIGDAAHLMTPHAGEGVNVAMEDALNLAHAIIRSVGNEDTVNILDKEVSAFEDEMMTRATKVQNRSLANTKDMYFTPGAPHTVIDNWVRRVMAQRLGRVVEFVLPLWFVGFVRQGFNWWYRVN